MSLKLAPQWSVVLPITNWNSDYELETDSKGNLLVAAQTDKPIFGQQAWGSYDSVLIKLNSSSGSLLWSRIIGTSSVELTWGLEVDAMDNVYISGDTYQNLNGQLNSGGWDTFVVAFSSSGDIKWTRLIGSPMNEESAGGISASSAGNIYVALSSSFTLDGQFNRGYSDVFVSALNSEGSRKWTRSIGSAGYDYPLSVTSSGNNFFISGSTSGSISGNPNPNPNNSNNFNKDLFVSKFDSTGKELWTKVLGLKFGWVVTSICAETSDGGILVALSSDGFQLDTVSGRRTFNGQEVYGNRDIVIVKLSAQGALQWTRILGSTESDYLYGLEVNADGNIFVGWSGYVGEKTLTEDSFITKLSPSGDIVWLDSIGSRVGRSGLAMALDPVGSIYTLTYDLSSLGTQQVKATKFIETSIDQEPPLIRLDSNKTSLKIGETATITLTLSKPSTDFVLSDITVSGGTLTNFTGSGTSYTATFSPTANSTANGVVSVASGKFSDAAGNFNADGADANNTVSLSIISTRTSSLTVLVDKGVLGTEPVLLENLVEEVTTTGTTVTAHTLNYLGTKFNYKDVDALITTVIRDGNFTDEFRKEITDYLPSADKISYDDLIKLVGTASIDGVLIRIAGSDGSYVG